MLATLLGVVLGLVPQTPGELNSRVWLVRDVRLDVESEDLTDVLLRNGRIESVGVGLEAPFDARVHEGDGSLLVAGFVDSYTHAGVETPEPWIDFDIATDTRGDVDVAMRDANRKGIQPTFKVVDSLEFESKDLEAWRAAGFSNLLSSPEGQLLAGISSLVSTRDAAVRETVVRPQVFMHAAFRATGSGYPNTLMGFMAQLRQFFLDVGWHQQLQRYATSAPAGALAPRVPYDLELLCGQELLPKANPLQQMRLACEANGARDIRRWIKLADEFGLRIAIVGGREAWKLADELSSRQIPVVLTLDWGEEVKDPDEKKDKKEAEEKEESESEEGEEEDSPEASESEDEDQAEAEGEETESAVDSEESAEEESEEEGINWIYEEPLGVRRAKRARWEEGRDCALRLHEAGVTFVFGTGSGNAKKLMGKVRQLVKGGLDRDVALTALSARGAELLRAPSIGGFELGQDANLGLWTDHPLEKGAQLAWLFVDGERHEFEVKDVPDEDGAPAEGVDLNGTWQMTVVDEDGDPMELELVFSMAADGALSGSYSADVEGEVNEGPVSGDVSGKSLSFNGTVNLGLDVPFSFQGEVEGESFSGEVTVEVPGMTMEMKATGVQTAKPEKHEHDADYEVTGHCLECGGEPR